MIRHIFKVSKKKKDIYFNEFFHYKHLLLFRFQKWMNDDLINEYVSLLTNYLIEKNENKSIKTTKTFFWLKMNEGKDFDYFKTFKFFRTKAKKEYKEIKVFCLKFMIVPMNVHRNHWIVAILEFETKKVHVWDSLGNNGEETKKEVLQWCQKFMMFLECRRKHEIELKNCSLREGEDLFEENELHKTESYNPPNVNNWKVVYPKNCWVQKGGFDCGVFAMLFMRHIVLRKDVDDFHSSMDEISYSRTKILLEIWKRRIATNW